MLKCWECLKETKESDTAYHVIETEDNDMEYVVCKSCVDNVVQNNFGEVHCNHCGKFMGMPVTKASMNLRTVII